MQFTTLHKRYHRLFGWNRTSYGILSLFLLTISLIIIIWWPLAQEQFSYWVPGIPWWWQVDWLLVGNFLVMSLLIMMGANLQHDIWIVFVGLAGGLAIEGWGTQTGLWTYFTGEAPPLWILPAWPAANLAINRIVRFLRVTLLKHPRQLWVVVYWIIFPTFLALMLPFVWPTIDKSLTVLSLLACLLLILSPTNHRTAVLTLVAGIGLGYFLERWGTTRECWTYYTETTTPLFTVLAHGMAAVAVWRVTEMAKRYVRVRGQHK
jgi:hypothetical protein